MFRRLLGFTAVLMLLPGLALAHGPTRQRVSESVTINAPPEQVWAVIGNFADMSWHPRVSMTDASNGSEQGSIRTIGYQSGEMMEEELSRYNADRMMFGTFIGHTNLEVIPATNYSSNVTVAPADDGAATEVTWGAAFYRGYPNNDPPADLNEEAAIEGVTAYIREGLDNLKQVVESGS